MKGEWVRNPGNSLCIVFVHGFLSDGDSCWRNQIGAYWPELLTQEPSLQSLGVYVFTYQTSLFSGSYRLSDVVDALKEHMRLDGVIACREIVFVCHSLGGIVVRKFLIERASELRSTSDCSSSLRPHWGLRMLTGCPRWHVSSAIARAMLCGLFAETSGWAISIRSLGT